jgi:hypothetical protein
VIYASDVAFPMFVFAQEILLVENAYIITAASAIAVAAIYFLCVRKLGAQGTQIPSPRESRENSQ